MKQFPPFRLDTVNECLWRHRDDGDDERIRLTPKAFAVLKFLVEHAGHLVTQNKLLEAVWPDTFVQPEVIKGHILDLRSALGDHPKDPRFIETLPRRGYRFIARVIDPSTESTRLEQSSPKLVGRRTRLKQLSDSLQTAIRGQRQVVFVTGEPGIGKTALVDEFQRQVAGGDKVRIARGQCVEGYGGKEAYYPMLEALGQLCGGPEGNLIVGILERQAPTLLVQFPAFITREHREMLRREIMGATRKRMLREICEALETITSENPLLLVFEDLHWVDRSTIDLISALARRRQPARLMVLGTYRPADILLSDHLLQARKQELLIHDLCVEMALDPLVEADVAEYLVGDAGGRAVPEGLPGFIQRRTEGNPMFMVTTLKNMRERKLITQENGDLALALPLQEIELQVPESLQEMIEIRIKRLSDSERRVLEAASVTGALFSAAVSAAAADMDMDDFEELCEGLSRRRQWVRSASPQELPDGTVSGRYQFAHELYREAFTLRLVPGRRMKLHQRVGERLEQIFTADPGEVAPQLALHFEESRDWPRAVKYTGLVAETAGRRYAPREAAAALERAVELSRRLPDPQRAISEIALLEKLAEIYVVSFDARAPEAYQALADRAAHYGLIDAEVRALIGMAYPLSWSSSQRCLEVLDKALRLSMQQSDPLTRARTRASCFVRRIWVGGWNVQDAAELRNVLAEIQQLGDRFVTAAYLIDYSVIQWFSSDYREAHRNAVKGVETLLDGHDGNLYFSFPRWLADFIVPWSLLFLGAWGQALGEIGSGIAIADRNGDRYRAQTLLLYQAWLRFHALDFASVITICESLLPALNDPRWRPWRRMCLVLAGSAKTALGNYDGALKHLLQARDETDQQTVIHDWYLRMLQQSALAELWLAQADLQKARAEAEKFLHVTLATAERTWQALAWEVNARVAMADLDVAGAHDFIAKGLSATEGFEVPLASWRVHGTAADLHARTGNSELAEYHRALSRDTIMKLANSLPATDPLRRTFLSAPAIRNILGGAIIAVA
jgi:DNA-binding winged helix-turn-helix (wHTH) protein/tetratricopeptide (TPR) repeat protein